MASTRPTTIDKLTPGDEITLRFTHGDEPAVFVKLEGTGDARRATFASVQTTPTVKVFSWDAYRYQGHWAYGTSADRLMLIDSPAHRAAARTSA